VKTPRWVDPRALVLLHAEALAEHGGLSGLRDAAALESALARPRHIYQYETKADIPRLAAACAYGIIQNHPFNDGNKRAGFIAAALLLELNGFAFTGEDAETIQTIFRLAAGEVKEPQFANWLRSHSTPKR
jgi:death on curing protein